MEYIQVSQNLLVPYGENKLIYEDEKVKPFIIAVPSVMWRHPDPKVFVVPHGQYNRVYHIEIANWEIQYRHGVDNVIIQYLDRKSEDWYSFELLTMANSTGYHLGREMQENLAGIQFRFSDTEKTSAYHIELVSSQMHWWNSGALSVRFRAISELMTPREEQFYNNTLRYGLRQEPYKIMYRGTILKRKYMAFVSGFWALLLDDNLEFDSIAYLRGTDEDTLYVDKFAYTADSYIAKVVTMIK